MSASVRISTPCKICRKGIGPATLRYCGNKKRGYICFDCRAKSTINMAQLTSWIETNYLTDYGQHCARCLKTLDQIEFETKDRSLFLHDIDGVKAFLCHTCSDWYIPKSGQFKDTVFGFLRGLHQGGNK